VETVRFVAVPVDAYLALQEWNDAINRECELISALGPGRSDLPPRLVDLAASLSGRFARDMEGFRETVNQARSEGRSMVDLDGGWPVPVTPAVEAAQSFLAAMEELDRYCGTDSLLTAPPEPVVVLMRRWFVTEMRAQLLAGAAPTAFGQPGDQKER
jgi:hypothetical protein